MTIWQLRASETTTWIGRVPSLGLPKMYWSKLQITIGQWTPWNLLWAFYLTFLEENFHWDLPDNVIQNSNSKKWKNVEQYHTNLNFSFWIFEFLQKKNDLIWIFRVLTFENEFGLKFLTFWKKISDILILKKITENFKFWKKSSKQRHYCIR